jgi:hypothetical protein
MKTIIEVIILKGGITAREVNKFGNERPTDNVTYTKGDRVIIGKEREYIHNATVLIWEQSEKELRTFEIDSQEEALKNIGEPKITTSNPETKVKLTSAHILYEPNKKHKAFVLSSGKIKIVPDKDSFYETFSKKMDGIPVTDGIYFGYTKLGSPNFMKDGSEWADKRNSISLNDWTPEQLEAMAKFMRENPLCKLMNDGSGN